jgi:hypothetical protein
LEICRVSAEENVVSVSGEVAAAMEDVVAEFLVLKHVECLLGQANAALASSSAISSDICNTAADTSELDIDYPTFSPIDTCESTVLTTPPCKSGFFDAEYASFGQREAMEEACVSCSPLPLAEAPTSWIQHHGLSHVDLDNLQCAPGSPAGCTATQVQLNGEYSPGPLVRVDNGHTTYRRTDQNSCPEGFKIYSPRSAEDWRTIEASVNFAEFNSPYNIVDVTRPSQGCGGCTGNAMNSDNAAQVASGWTTDDGSPWFLRHGAFGEPNGDYTANCYLHLWSPSNGEVYCHDGSCHYHSNRYLCQLRTDYAPPASATGVHPPNPAGTLYRLDVTENVQSNHWCIDQLAFYDEQGNKVPTESSRAQAQSQLGGINPNDRHFVGNAFGDVPGPTIAEGDGNYYCSQAGMPNGWLRYQFGSATAPIAAYQIDCLYMHNVRRDDWAPVSWQMSRSYDNGQTWTLIDEQSGQDDWLCHGDGIVFPLDGR